jgi:hypothetical protein
MARKAAALRARVALCRDPECVWEGDWAMTCPEHPGDIFHGHQLADADRQGANHIRRHRRMETNR